MLWAAARLSVLIRPARVLGQPQLTSQSPEQLSLELLSRKEEMTVGGGKRTVKVLNDPSGTIGTRNSARQGRRWCSRLPGQHTQHGRLAFCLDSEITIGCLPGSVTGLVGEAQKTVLIRWASKNKDNYSLALNVHAPIREKKSSKDNRDRQKPLVLSSSRFHRARHFITLNLPMSTVPSTNKTQLKFSHRTTLD